MVLKCEIPHIKLMGEENAGELPASPMRQMPLGPSNEKCGKVDHFEDKLFSERLVRLRRRDTINI